MGEVVAMAVAVWEADGWVVLAVAVARVASWVARWEVASKVEAVEAVVRAAAWLAAPAEALRAAAVQVAVVTATVEVATATVEVVTVAVVTPWAGGRTDPGASPRRSCSTRSTTTRLGSGKSCDRRARPLGSLSA